MTWLHPIAHLAWIGVAAAVALLLLAAARRRTLAARMGDAETVTRLGPVSDPALSLFRSTLLIAGLGMLVLAMAGPRLGTEPRQVELEGLDLVIALDVSRSMLAEDVAPSRLLRAREEAQRLAGRLGDDRVGLVTFAGDAYMQMPLSTDRSALRLYLQAASPDMVPTQGTSFAAMLAVAARVFEGAGDQSDRSRVLVVMSDGEDHEGGLDPHLRRLNELGVRVFALGIGSREGGPIPLQREDGQRVFHRDRSGTVVTTRLEDGVLKRIAGDAGYFEVTRGATAVDALVAALDRLERTGYATVTYDRYIERYQIPLGAAVLLLLVQMFVPERRKMRQFAEVAA